MSFSVDLCGSAQYSNVWGKHEGMTHCAGWLVMEWLCVFTCQLPWCGITESGSPQHGEWAARSGSQHTLCHSLLHQRRKSNFLFPATVVAVKTYIILHLKETGLYENKFLFLFGDPLDTVRAVVDFSTVSLFFFPKLRKFKSFPKNSFLSMNYFTCFFLQIVTLIWLGTDIVMHMDSKY